MARKGLALAAIDLLGALFLVALVMMGNPPKPSSAVKTYGLFAFTIQWPADCGADEDIYVRDPAGNVAFFNSKEVGGMHLENDDIPGSSGYTRGTRNFERIVVRSVQPGEYTLNVDTYAAHGCPHASVTAQLWRLEGDDTLVYTRRVRMRGDADERTAFRATLHADGGVSGVNTLPWDLVGG